MTNFNVSFPLPVITINDFQGAPVFQRTIASGGTSGNIIVSADYSGLVRNPQAQLRKISDNSIVVPWTTLASVTQLSTFFSGTILGAPTAIDMKAELRDGVFTSVQSAGTGTVRVGACFLLYGQSNMGVMSHTPGAGTPAANPGTSYYGVAPVENSFFGWHGGVPGGNGLRQLLNALNNALGVPVGAINSAIAASDAKFLIETNWNNVAADLIAMNGGDIEGVFWDQGENNTIDSSNNLPGQTQKEYHDLFVTFQNNIAALTGRTAAQCPIVVSSLSTEKPPNPGGAFNFWAAQQRNLSRISQVPNVTYSHTRVFAAMSIDGLHMNGDDCDKVGKMYARTMNTLKGATSGLPQWFITGASIVDATHTRVTLVHGLGTDFTPTSNIVGFEISVDGGATWFEPTGAARIDATTVELTHAAKTLKTRMVRYIYANKAWSANGVYAAHIIDNSAIGVPLNYTPEWIVCSGATSPSPVPRTSLPHPRQAFSNSTLQATMNSKTAFADAPSATRFVIVTVSHGNTSPSSVTVNPFAGDEVNPGSALTPVALTKLAGGATGSTIWGGIVAAGLSCDVVAQYPTNPFANPILVVFTVDAALMSSTTPAATQTIFATLGSSSITLNIATTADGFVIVCGISGDSFVTWSGTEAYAEDKIMPVGFGSAAHSAANAANASSAITLTNATNTNTVGHNLCAAAFR